MPPTGHRPVQQQYKPLFKQSTGPETHSYYDCDIAEKHNLMMFEMSGRLVPRGQDTLQQLETLTDQTRLPDHYTGFLFVTELTLKFWCGTPRNGTLRIS